MENFNIQDWQAKYLKENAEQSQNTLADYFSSRGGAVKKASRLIDQLIGKAELDPNIHNELVDAIIDLVDEIESDSDNNYEY